jgi:hypothetical protein
MNAANKQDAMKRFERARDFVLKENRQALDAVLSNKVSKMENILKTGGIEQEAIDHFIFVVKSVEMLKLFLRYGGDMHKIGPPGYPNPFTLLFAYTTMLDLQYAADSIKRRALVKLIEFLIDEGADVNAVAELGDTPFMNCARNGETGLCKLLVERDADPTAKRNDGATVLHAAAEKLNVQAFRYLVEDCGLDINAEYLDTNSRLRTPLYEAASYGNIEVCEYLLEMGAIVDADNQPMIIAAEV